MDTSLSALAVLEKANHVYDSATTYMAVSSVAPIRDGFYQTTFRRVNAAGGSDYRVEQQNKDGETTGLITLIISGQRWTLTKRIAVTYPKGKNVGSFDEAVKSIETSPTNAFDMSEVTFAGADCYRVDETLGTSAQKKYADAMGEVFDVPAPISNAIEPMQVKRYFIRKSDFAIMGREAYGDKGSLLFALRFKDVKLNTSLDASLFEIPSGVRKIVVATSDEAHDVLLADFKQGP